SMRLNGALATASRPSCCGATISSWPNVVALPTTDQRTTIAAVLSGTRLQSPATTNLRALVHGAHQRRAFGQYQEFKTALGLEHFEGRSYPGWQHHVAPLRSRMLFCAKECNAAPHFTLPHVRERRSLTAPCSSSGLAHTQDATLGYRFYWLPI